MREDERLDLNEENEVAQEEQALPPKEKVDYMTKVTLTQMIVCILFSAFVILSCNASEATRQKFKLDFENFMSYSISKEDLVESFSFLKSYFNDESRVWSVFGSSVTQVTTAESKSEVEEDQDENVSSSENTSSTTEEIGDQDLSLSGVGGEDLKAYDAKENASFAPIYSTVKAVNPIETPRYTSYFGYRDNPFTGEFSFHSGLDIAAALGTNIRATFNGKVTKIGEDEQAGKYIFLTHDDGMVTFYCHCSEIIAPLDANVLQGETIAKVGSTGSSTGPHVHFEVRKNDVRLNPIYILENSNDY